MESGNFFKMVEHRVHFNKRRELIQTACQETQYICKYFQPVKLIATRSTLRIVIDGYKNKKPAYDVEPGYTYRWYMLNFTPHPRRSFSFKLYWQVSWLWVSILLITPSHLTDVNSGL